LYFTGICRFAAGSPHGIPAGRYHPFSPEEKREHGSPLSAFGSIIRCRERSLRIRRCAQFLCMLSPFDQNPVRFGGGLPPHRSLFFIGKKI